MKLIKNLSVKVTYSVGLGDVEVPDDVFKELDEMGDYRFDVDSTSQDYPKAIQWLNDHIRESDACDCSYEVEELS